MIRLCPKIFSRSICPSLRRFLCFESAFIREPIIMDFFFQVQKQGSVALQQVSLSIRQFILSVRWGYLTSCTINPGKCVSVFVLCLPKLYLFWSLLTPTHNERHCQWACVFTYTLFELLKHL